MKSQILSIYLPQFHTIPENDMWWGEGFTEWTNVRRGRSFYPGHYQPREPLHDDYYDLSDLRTMEKHMRMARKAGIAGFCFYHYYFCGKKLLEKPIENYRDNSKEKFPYCLIWANQSWARTWYRTGGNQVLLQQTYGDENDWRDHFYYLLEFFKDDRYIKIDNKPVYIIYLPQDIKSRRRMFMFWQGMAIEQGFNGIYLIAMNTSFGQDGNSSYYDAFMDLEPLSTLRSDGSWRRYLQGMKEKCIKRLNINQCTWQNMLWTKNAYSYPYLCRKIENKARAKNDNTFYCVFAGWDNTSRKDEEGIVVVRCDPTKFRKHIIKMLKISERNGSQYIFLNAWNEWSEGAYIEPDKRYRYQYLRAVRDAIHKYEQGRLK